VAVPFVEPGELEAGGRFGQRVGGRIAEHVQVMLLFSMVVDEGRASQEADPRVALTGAARS
jgi:hypothetical protein